MPQEFLNRSGVDSGFVYVISSSSDVYHLPDLSEDATLCGLKIALVIINRPVKTSTLYLTESKPTDRELCAACAALEAKRRIGAGR